jgi:two-component system chemotaxis response regulator CheB
MTKVLIVDDSALMRRLIGGVLGDAGFTVETARNGREGVERLTEWQPDVVTLDINMPEMDGLTALSLMMQARPTPVVMVSSLTAKGAQATFEALALGAVDFIAKPGGTISLSVEDIAKDLIDKVRSASKARMRGPGAPARRNIVEPTAPRTAPAAPLQTRSGMGARTTTRAQDANLKATGPTKACSVPGLVLIGVSTGGPRTLEEVLPQLPGDYPWPIIIAQHMPANFTDAFAQRMARICALNVREANTTYPLEPGNVYIGKGGHDVVVAERLGRLVVMPKSETPGHPWHPSVDVLVESALRLVDPRQLIGVQLTGMGNDGARTMAQIKARGGRTIAESEETAVVFGMPAELIKHGGATTVLPCHQVARHLCGWVR